METTLHQLHIGELPAIHKPALIPYDGARALVLAHTASNFGPAANLLEAMAMQLLALHPAGRARLVIYEPTPSPRFANIKRVLAQTERRLGQQLLNPDEYHEHLEALIERSHRRFTLLASAQQHNIAAYNVHAARPEMIEYLLVSAVQGGTYERDLHALRSLCQHGPQVGIVPLLLRGPAELDENSSSSSRKPLQGFWNEVAANSFGFDWRGDFPVPINQPAELWRLFKGFGVTVGLSAARQRELADGLIAKASLAKENSPHSDFLRIPIGQEGVVAAHFAMGEACNVYHVMMGGTNRSGKSTLVNNIIVQACETHSPDALRLWLFDFKGVGFNIYEGLGHVAALYLKDEGSTAPIAAFAQFESLLNERIALFRAANPPAERIEDYNKSASRPLPRCLMIIDEAQDLFADRETKQHAKRMLSAVARKGASFGLHLILITQSYQNVELEADVKAQFRLRLALQLATDMECRALMGRDNTAPKHLPRYAAVYNSEFGEETANRTIQLHGLERTSLLQRLAALKAQYPGSSQPVIASVPPINPRSSSAAARAADDASLDF